MDNIGDANKDFKYGCAAWGDDAPTKCNDYLTDRASEVGVEPVVMRFGGLEYILCAAVHFRDGLKREHQPKNIESGIVVCGRRHHNALMTLFEFAKEPKGEKVKQGFLTNTDRFVTRKEAAQIAYKCGQITKEQNTLFSEDLW